jgi:hypothetical protein
MECFRERRLKGINFTKKGSVKLKTKQSLKPKIQWKLQWGHDTQKQQDNNPINFPLKIQNLHTTQKKTQN